MKLACAASAFAQAMSSGALTQLEWLDLCARRLQADGVVFDERQFPRRDSDYLAQLKKMCADLGLSIAALWSPEFFSAGNDRMHDTLALADALGAPLVTAPLSLQTARPWTEELDALNTATSLAKTLNITLALRNAPQTFATSAHDLKRASKEADSAWLRYALDVQALDAASDPELLLPKTVLLWHAHETGEVDSDEALESQRAFRIAFGFRGFLTLDVAGGSADERSMLALVRKWRALAAAEYLGDSVSA